MAGPPMPAGPTEPKREPRLRRTTGKARSSKLVDGLFMTTRLTDRQVTAEELIRFPDDGFRYELVRGELNKMTPAGFHHGAVIMNVSGPLVQHVKTHGLGVVCGAETGFRIGSNPDTVLAPDVAFVRRDRLPASGRPATGREHRTSPSKCCRRATPSSRSTRRWPRGLGPAPARSGLSTLSVAW